MIFTNILVLSLALTNADSSTILSVFGKPKYPENFQHVEYADPERAIKGGTVVFSYEDRFDSVNLYTVKGSPAPGLEFLYDPLMVQTFDDPFSVYAHIADRVVYSKDHKSIQFHIDQRSRHHDGVPISAVDVAFSFQELVKTNPQWRLKFKDVEPPVVIDRENIRFNFRTKSLDLPLTLAALPVLPKHYWQNRDLGKSTMELPVGNGPYRILKVDPGHSIIYERVKDYWAQDLPTMKGRNNFDRVQYDVYLDSNVSLEALKAGNYDIRQESTARLWARAYDFPAVKKGLLIKEMIPYRGTDGMWAYIMNLRRPQFQDRRVRKALNIAFNFEWMKTNFFFNTYTRIDSYFTNSKFTTSGLPTGLELKILNKYRDRIPQEVFSTVFRNSTNSSISEVRRNLREAMGLLQEAGWTMREGVLRNSKGEPFRFELITSSKGYERINMTAKRTFAKLGIDTEVRVVDSAQITLKEKSFDFDVYTNGWNMSDLPGNELRAYWASASANEVGAKNYPGIQNVVIDELIQNIAAAKDFEVIKANVSALNRILLFEYYVIPAWSLPFFRLAYWNRFGRPQKITDRGIDYRAWWIDPELDKNFNFQRGK